MDLFKQTLTEGSIRMNRAHHMIDLTVEDDGLGPRELQVKQFQIEVENLIQAFENESDVFLEWLIKVFCTISDKNQIFPIEYFEIFCNYNIYDLLIKIMTDFPINQIQVYVISCIYDTILHHHKIVYGLPYVIDEGLFLKFMKAPIIEMNGTNLEYPYISLYYSKLIELVLDQSYEITQAFCNSNLFQVFIGICTDLTKEEYIYASSWAPLIIFFSSSKFPIEGKKKFELNQVYDILYLNKEYGIFLKAVDQLTDSAGDELYHYIYQTDIYSKIIGILIDIERKENMQKSDDDKEIETDMKDIQNRKICLFILYKMISNDKNHFCDLTFLPINYIASLIQRADLSDQISSLQLLTLYLKKSDSTSISIIEELDYHGVYRYLLNNSDDFSFGSKSLMIEFFILSLIKANMEQLERFEKYGIFEPVLQNIDCSNMDLIEMFNIFLQKILPNQKLFATFLFPNADLLSQIAEDVDPQIVSTIDEVCARISIMKSRSSS